MSGYQPICFMVMPFGIKDVVRAKAGAPVKLNFDRLWDLAFTPAIQVLGFVPIRADAEADSIIVKGMLNRLKHADLVIADVSIPNGNVYYEVGVRHVAKEKQCVLVAADWFEPLFDVASMRVLTYAHAATDVTGAEAARIVKTFVTGVEKLRKAQTPYHALVDEHVEQAFASEVEQLSRFQVDVGTVRQTPKGDARSARIRELVHEHARAATLIPEVAIELLYLIRDMGDWRAVCDFAESLPDDIRAIETIQEQYQLALSETGRIPEAIAGLQELIRRFGPTPERCGLLGGRFKRLYRTAHDARVTTASVVPSLDERDHLARAIAAYEQGFQLDLNEYYCSDNLPSLLRSRDQCGDAERADWIEMLVIAASRRAVERNSQDPWLPNTLFGAAFRRGDLTSLGEIVDLIELGLPWRLGSTLKDASGWIRVAPEEKRAQLKRILDRLGRAHDERANP